MGEKNVKNYLNHSFIRKYLGLDLSRAEETSVDSNFGWCSSYLWLVFFFFSVPDESVYCFSIAICFKLTLHLQSAHDYSFIKSDAFE